MSRQIEQNTLVFPVKLCEICKVPWERQGTTETYYKGFPTYGLVRRTCSKCFKKHKTTNK